MTRDPREEDDEELPRHVDFDGISWVIPPPSEGGNVRVARAFGVSARTVQRWKRAGKIPFFSADRALARVGEHPIGYWPEAFGLPASDAPRVVPRSLSWPKRSQPMSVSQRSSRAPKPPRFPRGAISVSPTRVLLAVLALQSEGLVTISALVERVGLTRSTVWTHLDALRNEGLVSWEDGKSGTLRACVSARECRYTPTREETR